MFDLNTLVQQIVLNGPPLVLAITLLEAAHGWFANRLGDSTAKLAGRLSLNPIAHVDPFGTIIIPLLLYPTGFIFGYAKPVPVNFSNLRHPKRDMIWVAAAGPGTNLALALVFAFLFYLIAFFQPELHFPMAVCNQVGNEEGLISRILIPLGLMCYMGVKWNILLAIFNLIPIPPLDGGRVLVGLLPHRQAEALGSVEPFGFFIIMALVFLPIGFTSGILLPIMDGLTRLFTGIPFC